jgi:hypothetical protein
MDERHLRFLTQLEELDPDQIAVTAALAEPGTGRLGSVAGVGEKLDAALRDAAATGRLRCMAVATGQSVDGHFTRLDARPLRVVHASNLFDLVEDLWREEGPSAAVLAKVLELTRRLELFGKRVELLPEDNPDRQVFQPIPLLVELTTEGDRRLSRQISLAPSAAELAPIEPIRIDRTAIDRRTAEYLAGHGATGSLPVTGSLGWTEDFIKQSYELQQEVLSIDHLFDRDVRTQKAPRAVILGQPGGGKSTVLQYLALQFARRRLAYRGRWLVPVVVRLARWCQFALARRDHQLAEYLSSEHPGTEPDWWVRRLNRGDALLLFDGLDEVDDPEDDFITAGLKAALIRFKQCPAAVTCRTLAFQLPLYRSLCQDLPVFHLAPLSEPQIVRYAQGFARVFEKDPEKLSQHVIAILAVPQLRSLAANPLLLSVLCLVLSGRADEAPPLAVRVELFDDAVNRLLRRPRDLPEPLEASLLELRRTVLEYASLDLFERQTGQDKAVVLDMPLMMAAFGAAAERAGAKRIDGARFLSDSVGRGLVQRSDLPGDRPGTEPVYSYLHLQFQEYLAGCALKDDREFIRKVFDRLSSPRWREVILLAIGQMTLAAGEDAQQVFDRVVELLGYSDPFNPLLPRAALLLVTALPDLTQLPDDVTNQLAESLLEVYTDRDRMDVFPDLARQLERAFVRLTAVDDGYRVLPRLLERLKGIETDPAPALAAARLIRSARLYNEYTVEALLAAFPFDDAEWGWPIDAALSDLAADDQVSDLLGGLLDSKIPFRQLRTLPEERERFRTEPFWLWVGVALFGGFDARHRARLQDARERVVHARRAEEEAKKRAGGTLGPEESQRLTAAISDAEARVNELNKVTDQLSPRFFHRPSPLGDWLWERFLGRRPVAEVLQELGTRLGTIADPLEEADVLLVLAAVLPGPSLLALARAPQRLAASLQRLEPVLADTVESALTRAFGPDTDSKPALGDVDDAQWGRLLAAVARVTSRYTPKHPFTLDLSRRSGSLQGRAERLAEFWQRSVLDATTSDDAVYNWCVLLDTVGATMAKSPEVLAHALASVHTAGNARPGSPAGWPLDPLGPRVSARPLPAILGNALDALAALPYGLDFVRGWALARLAPLLRTAGMLAEAELLALVTVSDRFDARQDALRELATETENEALQDRLRIGARQLILKLRSESADPYVHARLALAVREFFHDRRGDADAEEVLAFTRRLGDPVLRAWLLERLAHVVEPVIRPRVLAAAWEAARAIPWDDQDNRTRAVVRLAAFEPERADASLAEHLHELDAGLAPFDAARPELRVQALATLREYVRGRETLAPLFETAVARLPEGPMQLAARGFAAFEVLGAIREMPEPIVILGLAAVVSDLRQAIAVPDDPDGVWLALTTAQQDAALARLAELARRGGLRLTRSGTLALSRLAEAGAWDIVRTVLPWVRSPDPIAGALLARLAEAPDEEVRNHATLLTAELAGLSLGTIPRLVQLLQSPSGDYFTRSRAALTLYGDRSEWTSPLFASRLDRPALETLMRLLLEVPRNQPGTALSLVWTFERVVFDDPDLIRNWAVEAARTEGAEIACGLLARMSCVSQAGWWEVLRVLEGVEAGPKSKVFRSVCALAHRGLIKDHRWAQLARILERLDPGVVGSDQYILDGPGTIVDAAVATRDRFGERLPSPTVIANVAREAFLDRRETVRSALEQLPAEPLRKRLGEIGSLRFTGVHHDQLCTAAAARIEERPELLRVLVPWLIEALRRPGEDFKQEGYYVSLLSDLLVLVAEAAERLPGEFRKAATAKEMLTRQLAGAAQQHNSFPARQAAFRLLAVLGTVTSEVMTAYRAVLRDTVPVQATAMNALGRYREINERFVASILHLLTQERCPTTRYVAIRILAAVARNVFLKREVRDQIVEGFRRALIEGDMQRDVYLLTQRQDNNQNDVYRLEYLGRLDRLLHQELIELSGVGFDPTVSVVVREGER